MSDANLLSKINCKKNFLWSHSIQSIEKFIRKKQLLPFIKFKPTMILEVNIIIKVEVSLPLFWKKNT